MASLLDAVLVEFFRQSDDWSAFVITSETILHVPLPKITEDFLDQQVNLVRRITSRIERCPFSYRLLEELYQAVIEPLEPYLPEGGQVILAPYSSLHTLPLSAARNPASGKYLIDRFRLAFAPSLSALWVRWNQAWQIGAAGEYRSQALSIAYPGVETSPSYLPNVVPEAESIAGHFDSVTRLYHQDATPDAVLSQARDHDLIHLGCHGMFMADQPEQSGLLLAGGWLTVQRILTELKLADVRVCTLGACVSGLANVSEGDEPLGVAHAMLVAGAETVIASLWNVHDAATRALFEAFYTGIADGQSAADALRLATQTVRQSHRWQHPYYWAAFQAIGLAFTPTAGSLPTFEPPVLSVLPEAAAIRNTKKAGQAAKETIEDGLSLLKQLRTCEDLTRAALAELGADREIVLSQLTTLSTQLFEANDSLDLLRISHSVLRLIEETPTLRRRFMLEDTRETLASEQRQRELLLKTGISDDPLDSDEFQRLLEQMKVEAGMIATACKSS